VSNEGYFTLEALRILSAYLPSHWSGVIEMCHMALPAHALRAVKPRLKRSVMKGTLLLRH
jgi:hypothetical protein